MADAKGAFQVLTSDNRGPIITLVSVSFLIVAILFVIAKLGSVLYFKQRRTAVNTPIWIALALSIIQVVILQKAVDNGLGRHQARLSEVEIEKSSKFMFAAHILLIFVLSFSKVSTILLIWKLTPINSLRRYCTITTGVIIGWTIFAVFAIAFQCTTPELWIYAPDRCAGEGALFYPIAVSNVLTEIVLVVLPFIMMRNVQMEWRKRAKILCSFSVRLCVAGIGIAQLALIPSFVRSTDITWDIVDWEVCSQAMMLTTVTIACVPTLYHIFAGLHSGLFTTEIPERVELSRTKTSGYRNQSSFSGQDTRGSERERRGRSLFAPSHSAVVTEITSSPNHIAEVSRESGSSEGAESTRHLTQEVKQGGVMKTVDITMEVEDNPLPRY
ncbi:hypothetical protein BJX99DRAFT_65345 [Aspergillus californicus]